MPRRLKVRLRTLTPSIEVRILAGHPALFFPPWQCVQITPRPAHWFGQTPLPLRTPPPLPPPSRCNTCPLWTICRSPTFPRCPPSPRCPLSTFGLPRIAPLPPPGSPPPRHALTPARRSHGPPRPPP